MLRLEAVTDQDFEAMLALRIAALRESLERLGRFDPERARQRFQEGFEPVWMRHIVDEAGQRIGFYTLKPRSEGQVLRLVHLYLQPGSQSQGAGAWVMNRLKEEARQSGCELSLAALKLSRANGFYQRHGFELVQAHEFDNEYRWSLDLELRA